MRLPLEGIQFQTQSSRQRNGTKHTLVTVTIRIPACIGNHPTARARFGKLCPSFPLISYPQKILAAMMLLRRNPMIDKPEDVLRTQSSMLQLVGKPHTGAL